MAGRRTNLVLLVLLLLALVTGAAAFAAGTSRSGRWVVMAHAVIGIAIVLLSPWKSVIARRGLSRRRPGRTASIVFSVLIVAAVVAGIGHSTGVARSFGVVTAMQVHVGAALLAVPLAMWHVLVRRVRVHRSDFARRRLLRAGALISGAAVAYGGVQALTYVLSLPGRTRRFTGSFETGSFAPDDMPVTQWLNDAVPEIDVARWRLRAGQREWSYGELEEFDDRVVALLDCTGGWFATQQWTGVRLDRLLGDASARSVAVTSVTGYTRLFPARDLHHLLLATRVAGRPLTPGHGYPARIVAPGRRGFWWVKWVERIEMTDTPWWAQPPFPLT